MGRGTPAPEPRHERLTDRGPNDLLAVNELHSGRYGPYVKHGSVNATLPDPDQVDSLTLEQALELIAAKAKKGGGKSAKAPVKPPAKPPAKPTAKAQAKAPVPLAAKAPAKTIKRKRAA